MARGSREADSIQTAIATALALVEETSAQVYRPAVHDLLAEIADCTGDANLRALQLRNAHDLYANMGATGHARRMAAVLVSCGHPPDGEQIALDF